MCLLIGFSFLAILLFGCNLFFVDLRTLLTFIRDFENKHILLVFTLIYLHQPNDMNEGKK